MEQNSWYYGPHFGIRMSYSIKKLLFSIEYHYEEGKTKIKEYRYNIKNLNIEPALFTQLTNLESLDWNSLFKLPKTILIQDIHLPINKFYKNTKYYLIAQTIYYGFSYAFSNNASFSLVVYDIIAGNNVYNNLVLNLIITLGFY